jgi:hypothetical protein
VAGDFVGVGGQGRQGLAALDPVTGLADAWNPAADRSVYSLARQGDTLYVGGDFLSMGSTRRVGLAAFRLDTGELLPWSANVDNAWVWSLALLGDVLYVGGDFTSIKGQQREHLAAVTTRTGELLPWYPYANNRVFSVSAAAGQVYAGSFFDPAVGRPHWRTRTPAGSQVRFAQGAGRLPFFCPVSRCNARRRTGRSGPAHQLKKGACRLIKTSHLIVYPNFREWFAVP